MRVLVSTGIFPNRTDGNRGIYIFKQALALSRRAEVKAVAPVPYFPPIIPLATYRRYAEIPTRDTLEGIDTSYPRYLVIPKVARFLHGWTLFASTFRFYRRIVASFRPDVILGFFAYPYGFGNALLGKAFKLPVVVSCRGSDINWLARPFMRRRMISWALRNCDRVLAVSADLGEKIVDLGVPRERVEVVANGIETERFRLSSRADARKQLGLPADQKVIVCVSRLSFEKGIDILVDASQTLGDDAHIYVVGDGAARPDLERQIAQLADRTRISLVGARPHDEVPIWMSAADVTVLSSRTEGHPNVVLESLASGRPVVAARVGGAPEILHSDDLGILVTPENAKALGEGLNRALARDWDEDRLYQEAARRTWDNVAADLEKILEDVIQHRQT